MYMVCVFTVSPTAIYMYSTIILLSSFTPVPFHHIINSPTKAKLSMKLLVVRISITQKSKSKVCCLTSTV